MDHRGNDRVGETARVVKGARKSFRGGIKLDSSANLVKQRKAYKKLSETEQICGMTADELIAQQRQLKADFLARTNNQRSAQ